MCDLPKWMVWEPASAGGISVEPAGYRYLISANLATAWKLGPPTVRHPLGTQLTKHWRESVDFVLGQAEYGMPFPCEYNNVFVLM